MADFFKLDEYKKYINSLRDFTEIDQILNQFSQKGEIWTFIKYPKVTPQYLISNYGKCYNIKTNSLLKKNFTKKQIYYHQLKTNDIKEHFNINRRFRIQKLVALNFLELDDYIINNINDFEIINYNNDLNSLDLNKLYFVQNIGKRKPFTIEKILEIRGIHSQDKLTVHQLANEYNAQYKTMKKILDNETWRIYLSARSLADETSAGVEGGLQNKIDNSRQKSTESRKVPLPAHRYSKT